MPAYEYTCPNAFCDEFEVVKVIVKSMSESGEPEECAACHAVMDRSFTSAPSATVRGGTPQFHGRNW